MRIKIIICGWWYDKFDHRENLTEFIEGLIFLNESNDNIDIFWACHKEPIDLVKNNFEWKLYENVGLEWGAYNKAFDELKFEDDDYVFCIQDDMVIKDWGFVEACVSHLSSDKIKIIGNGFNYPYDMKPQEEARLSYWLNRSVNSDNKKYANYKWIDYVRPENQHMFDETVSCLSIRGSFLATRWKHIKLINGFEYVNVPLCEGTKEDGTKFLLTDPFGNTSLYLNAYKFSKYFGQSSFKWLSNIYRKSKWMIECGRGNVDLPQDNETQPFNIPQQFLIDGYEYEEDKRT